MLRATPMLMGGGAGGITLPQTVFATSLYTGNNANLTINNGLDLLGQGGLAWIKNRTNTAATANEDHGLYDSARGVSNVLQTSKTSAEATEGTLKSFNADGFSLSVNSSGNPRVNTSGNTYASWSFCKAPKFFQIVTYTGDGTSGRQIPHTLGVAPGMIVVKRRDAVTDWDVCHRSCSGGLYLNRTDALLAGGTAYTSLSQSTATTFRVENAVTNITGATYIAYLWAHDPDTTNGIVQCGSFTADGSGNASVNLGWSPQWVLIKQTNAVSNWWLVDTTRGWDANADPFLCPNLTQAEATGGFGQPTSTGFTGFVGSANATYVYLAIRAPVFLGPTRPQDAFATSLYTGTGVNSSVVNGLDLAGQGGLVWEKTRGIVNSHRLADTLRGGGKTLSTDTTGVETTSALYLTSFSSTGFARSAYDTGTTVTAWSFVRKPKFFDCVTYTGDGTSGRQIAHALGVAPGMVVVKSRDQSRSWTVYHRSTASNYLLLNLTSAAAGDPGVVFGNGSVQVPPTASVFTVGSSVNVNAAGEQYVAYLWAHDPSPDGIVQAGGFTTNASLNASVSLGWGPQYLLIKSTNLSGDWILLDTARLIGNRLRANTSAAEDALGAIALTGTGFTVTGLGQGSDTYVYLAIRAPTT